MHYYAIVDLYKYQNDLKRVPPKHLKLTKENNFDTNNYWQSRSFLQWMSTVHCFCHIHKNLLPIAFSNFREKNENIEKNYKIMTNKSIYFLWNLNILVKILKFTMLFRSLFIFTFILFTHPIIENFLWYQAQYISM